MLLYCLFRMLISLPVNPDEQAQFIRQFKKYEAAVRRTATVNIPLQPESTTLRYLFFRVTAEICSTIVQYMNWFTEEEAKVVFQYIQSAASKAQKEQQQKSTPRPTVLALYKMKEFYIPVCNRSSFDQELLCYVCKVRPIYRPCTRLNKKLIIGKYKSKCLQCFIEYKLSTDSTYFDGKSPLSRDALTCSCHRNHYLLLFPSFMMYASESSHRIVIRSRIMAEMCVLFGVSPHTGIMPVTASPFGSPISGPLFASSSWTMEKSQYVDKHYIYQVISRYLTDHVMVCSGACAEMRGIIRITGASQRSLEFTKLVSLCVGGSHSMPVLESASPRYDLGTTPSTPAQRLYLMLQRLVATNVWQRTEPFHEHMKSRTKDNYYCNVCQMYIYALYSTIVRLCPPDSSYLISKRQKEYSAEKTQKNISEEGGECSATAASDEEQQLMDTREDNNN